MNPLFFVLPLLIIYSGVRAMMHRKAGRQRWCILYLFVAGFFACILIFEMWMQR